VFHPRFDLLLSPEEVGQYIWCMQEFIKHYGYLDKQQFPGWYVLHSGNDRFCNHSTEPTLIARHLGGCQYDMVASRDLVIGDELTCDYSEYEGRQLTLLPSD
jgi:hypothetical protein